MRAKNSWEDMRRELKQLGIVPASDIMTQLFKVLSQQEIAAQLQHEARQTLGQQN